MRCLWGASPVLCWAIIVVGLGQYLEKNGTPLLGDDRDASLLVVELADSTFDDFIKKEVMVMVMFLAPWCPWSLLAMPTFQNAAAALKHHDPSIKFATVDVTRNVQVRQSQLIFTFPTFALYFHGERHDYQLERTHTRLVKWIMKIAGTEGKIDTTLHLHSLLLSHVNDIVLLAGFNHTSAVDMQRDNVTLRGDTFHLLSAEFPNLLILNVSNPVLSSELVTKYSLEWSAVKLPFLLLVNPLSHQTYHSLPQSKGVFSLLTLDEPPIIQYTDGFDDFNLLVNFIAMHRLPGITPVTGDVIHKIADDPRPYFILFLDPSHPNAEEHVQVLRQPAKAYRAKLLFLICFLPGQNIDARLEYLSYAERAIRPTYRILEHHRNAYKKFVPSEDVAGVITQKTIGFFANEYIHNRLTQHLASEPLLREEDNKGYVRILVGKSFEQEVYRSKRDTFVVFHAPWCGHCRQFEPTLLEVAEKLARFPNIVVAKMDATRNEVDGLFISSYPQMFFYGAGKKAHPEQYSGSRNVDAIIHWLASRVSEPFDANKVLEEKKPADQWKTTQPAFMPFDQEL